MAKRAYTDCAVMLDKILALARLESVLIEAEDYDAIWPLREKRRALTDEVAGQWQKLYDSDDRLQPEGKARIARVLKKVHEFDQRNLSQLNGRKEAVREDLRRLHGGRQAVQGYRVHDNVVPAYVDERG